MKIEIEFNVPDELSRNEKLYAVGDALMPCIDKIAEQISRPPSLCDEPEGADLIYDANGNRIGTVKVTL